ncbi:AAA family ATPase [Rossellomorea vietnamensis]|uniref:Nuclease SbcCD subunit C n=1 Tax=Rossellomorea vietnamensis TaxID=218284 RepID=A0A6I6UMN9_9BACI|nr:SMC family ATPase [Rossellomorea vietnamensis]QHE59820.1 AAA family ATPase [Rossellomorea vietnamensis]
MKFDKITLKNFRNYRGRQTFELNNEITILYGDNGNGKSSFFDGIEWCLTGVITRFSENKAPKEVIANKNIDVGEDCVVEIQFGSYCLKRTFTCTTNGFGNIDFSLFALENQGAWLKIANGEVNVDKALRKILEENGVKYKDIKYRVGEIINKAYILSQDQVADFVTRDKPNERYNALASIMGFERILKIRKNLNTSIKCSTEILDSLSTKISDLTDKEQELNNSLKPVNFNKIEQFKAIYEFEPEHSSDIEKEINKLQSELFSVEQQINAVQKFRIKEVDYIQEIDNLINGKQVYLSTVEQTLKEYLIERSQLDTKITQIKESIGKLSKNEKVNNQLKKINEKLEEYKKQLNELNIKEQTSQELREIYSELNRKKRHMNFARQNREEYSNAKSFLDEYDLSMNNKVNDLKKQKEKLQAYLKRKKILESELLNVDENSSLNNLIKSIEVVNDYVKSNELDICPVCLSKVGEGLQPRISGNLTQLIKEVGVQKEIVAKKIKEKNYIEDKKAQQKKLIRSLEQEIDNLKNKKSTSIESIGFLERSELFSKYILIPENELTEAVKYIQENLTNTQTAIKIHEQINDYDEQLKNLNLDKNLLGENKESLDNTFMSLEKELAKKDEFILEKEKIVSEFKNNIFKLQKVKDDYTEYLVKYNTNSLSEAVTILNEKRTQMEGSLTLIKSILPIIEDRHYNLGIQNEIGKAVQEILSLTKKVDNIQGKLGELKNILFRLDSVYGSEATDFLNSDRSTIQTYYRYLNPTPSQFSDLYFEVIDNEELYIKIFESGINFEEESRYYADANMVLSSGQLNVLALAIFIATNEAQSCSYFDFIAIDDPIQNMDDVNRFSICDVLSQLNRQLIFSTHDQEFLNLFLKKNEERVDKITLYTLNSDENKYQPLSLTMKS